MKRTLYLASALSLVAFAAFAHDSTQSLTPATAAIGTSQTSAFAGTGGGLSISAATNRQTATTAGAQGGTAGSLGHAAKWADVGVSGTAATSGISAAGNLSVGNASGSAQAAGVSTASIVGAGEAHTVHGGPLSTVSGNAEAVTGTAAASGSNGLAVSGSAAVGTFDAQAHASQIKLGPLQHVDVGTSAVASAVTLPSVSLTLGSGTVSIQNEAAANAFGQAKVGATTSTSN